MKTKTEKEIMEEITNHSQRKKDWDSLSGTYLGVTKHNRGRRYERIMPVVVDNPVDTF